MNLKKLRVKLKVMWYVLIGKQVIYRARLEKLEITECNLYLADIDVKYLSAAGTGVLTFLGDSVVRGRMDLKGRSKKRTLKKLEAQDV